MTPAVTESAAPLSPDEVAGDPTEILREALDEVFDEWTRRLDRELTGRIRRVLSEARDAHRAAMDEAGLDPEVDGTPPSFDAMRDYRKAMHAAVVRPILQLANEVDPGRRTGTLMDGLYDDLVRMAQEAPEVLRRPAPPDRYRPSEEDGLLRSTLKNLFRGGAGVSGVFRSEPPVQTLRLRSIAAAALHRDDVEEGGAVADALYKYYAQVFRQIEFELGSWIRDWLPLETEGHTPEAHLEPEARERLGRLREELRKSSVEAGAEETPTPEEGEEEEAPPEDAPTPAARSEEEEEEEKETGEVVPERPGPGAVAARLQDTLDAIGELPPPEGFLSELRTRFDQLGQRLEDRIREGGTPFARTAVPGPRRVQRSERKREARRDEWRGWFDVSIDRVRLTDEFLTLRSDAGDVVEELYASTLEDSVFFLAERVEDSKEGLLSLRDRTPEAPKHVDDEDPGVAEALASDTWSIEEEARKLLDLRLINPLQERNPRAQVEQAASDTVDALGRRLGHLPQKVTVHPIREPAPLVDPDQPVRTIALREVARQGLDVLHLEGLRTAPSPLIDYLTRVEGECRQVVEMVAFSLSSAREALLAVTTSPEEEPEDPDAPPPVEDDEADDPVDKEETGVEAAQTLYVEGLERAADGLDVILAPAITAWDEFAASAHTTLQDGRDTMHARLVVEGTVQEQLRDVRSLIRSWWRGNVDRAHLLRKEYGPPIRRWATRLYIRGLRLVRRGQSAMGATDNRKTERAAEVLGRIPALLEPLPLIYRRLYSFQPLTDPGLMVGRENDRLWLATQYARWVEGSCPPVVLTGAMAVGHTSLLNVVAHELSEKEEKLDVIRVVPSTRYLDETAVATRLARGLWGAEAERHLEKVAEPDAGAEAPETREPDEGPRWTFRDLEKVLRKQEDQRMVFLERLEHFMLRVPGGCSLAERFLAFQSRTATQVFWVNSVSDPAWKLLTTTEPHAAGLVQIRQLETPDRKTLEELLLTRHRRSGVPLEFTEPGDLNPLVKRKLKRARADKDRQDVLRADFFDWLFRASQGNVLMAILMWLRSADFKTRPGWLRLQPAQAIRFAFLEEMDLPTSFALKAFLEHESLTLDEYSRVFAVSFDEAFQTLEVLRRKVLIDRLDTPGGLPVPVRRLEEGVRYRIPPIITQVIAQNLRDQNILH